MNKLSTITLNLKRFVLSVALLLTSISLVAQPEQADQEKAFAQRLYEAQMGSESEYYTVHKDFMDYLEQRHDWEKYYRTWLNRVVHEVNQRRFHRAFAEIHLLTDDIKKRHQEKYLYISNMGMGVFYNGRYQPEKGERFFRRALQGINADKDPVAMFNVYLSLAQSLSFKRPADAMASLYHCQ